MIRSLQLNRVGLCGFALLAALVAVRDLPFWARTAAGALLLCGGIACLVISVKQIRSLLRSIGLALLAAALGVSGRVTSPTFCLVHDVFSQKFCLSICLF